MVSSSARIADAVPQPVVSRRGLSVRPLEAARPGRRVIDGAFAVLEALSHAQQGLGLTDLANASGLAKTSSYRLAEQLVAVGAVQRLNHRYFIGPLIGLLGKRWQPDPVLRQVCEEPIRRLCMLTGAAASVYVLHEERARLVTATVPAGQLWVPPGEFDAETTPHTALGRVLLAAIPQAERPAAIPQSKWELWRVGIRDQRFAITESDHTPEGCCCAAAPIWRGGGDCAGATAVLARGPALSRVTAELLLETAQRIGQTLHVQQIRSASPSVAPLR